MKYIYCLLILPFSIILAVILGCGEDVKNPVAGNQNPDDTTNTNVMMPLTMGNMWVYETEFFIDDVQNEWSRDTLVIDSSFTKYDLVWYGEKNGDVFSRNDTDGLWRIEIVDSILSVPKLAYPYPATVNKQWYETSDSDTMFYTLANIDVTIPTPAGSFSSCYYIVGENTTGESHSQEWLKPGIGLVRSRISGELFGVSFRVESDIQFFKF